MARLLAALALVGGTAVRPTGAQAPAPGTFVVAVSEGETLLPLARYDGRQWLNTWPEPEEDSKPVPALADVPTAWLGRPVPSEWTLWLTGGGTARMEIGATARSGGCVVSPKLTVRGERLWPPEGAYDQVHPGLATTDGAQVAAIHMLAGRSRRAPDPTGATLQQRIQPVIASLFTVREREALAAAVNSDGRPTTSLTLTQLASLQPTVDWLYRSAQAGRAVLYFEASKRAAPSAQQRVTVRGWLRLDASGGGVPIGIEAYVAFDEDPGRPADSIANVSDQIPLGVIQAGDRDLWVLELPAGESTDFALDEITETTARRVLRVNAGGC